MMDFMEVQRQAFKCEMGGDTAGALSKYRQALKIGDAAYTDSYNRASVTIGCMAGLRASIKRLEVQS